MTDLHSHKPPEAFLRAAAALGIDFEVGDLEKLGLYLAMLLDANTRFNLTAITVPDEAWMRHILDSLTLVPFIASAEGNLRLNVIDVGSGGGLPGIPLAIVMPEVKFTLLEATGKKARFLEHVAQQLELRNVTVVTQRAEEIGQQRDESGHRERYDIVVARAVGRMPVLLELTVPLAKVGGHVLAMKGEKAAEEIAQAKSGPGGGALHLLHARVVETVAMPAGGGTLVIIEKQRKTPRIYPRKPGEPKRMPLG